MYIKINNKQWIFLVVFSLSACIAQASLSRTKCSQAESCIRANFLNLQPKWVYLSNSDIYCTSWITVSWKHMAIYVNLLPTREWLNWCRCRSPEAACKAMDTQWITCTASVSVGPMLATYCLARLLSSSNIFGCSIWYVCPSWPSPLNSLLHVDFVRIRIRNIVSVQVHLCIAKMPSCKLLLIMLINYGNDFWLRGCNTLVIFAGSCR